MLVLQNKLLNCLKSEPSPVSHCTCLITYTENLWLAITTEDTDEAVQSSDPFPSIIHPARGDRNVGLLFSQRPRNPIYSREQRKCQAVVEWITKTAREWRRYRDGVLKQKLRVWGVGVHKKWSQPSSRHQIKLQLIWKGKKKKKLQI